MEEPGNITSAQGRQQILNEAAESLSQSRFRSEHGTYLDQLGLDSSMAKDGHKWSMFLDRYSAIIEDCPLACFGKNLKFVEEVWLNVVYVASNPKKSKEFARAIRRTWNCKSTGRRVRKHFAF